MLKIFNDIKPFFEDNYREINVRAYSKMIGVTPPTGSKLLVNYRKENLLISRAFLNNILYRADRENLLFVDLMQAYYRIELKSVVDYIGEMCNFPIIVLFGSLAKAEAKIDSDIDLFVNVNQKKINLRKFENKRSIQLHFKSEIKNKELLENIKKGLVLLGDINGLG